MKILKVEIDECWDCYWCSVSDPSNSTYIECCKEGKDIESTILYWPDTKRHPNTLDYIKENKIDLIINIPKNLSQDELYNDYDIRRAAVDHNIPLITNARLASAFIIAFCKYEMDDITIKSWDEYTIS